MNGKIPIGISHVSMTQKGRQYGQTPFNIFACSIPLNQSIESKSVPEMPRAAFCREFLGQRRGARRLEGILRVVAAAVS
jgi:hypothetical protein